MLTALFYFLAWLRMRLVASIPGLTATSKECWQVTASGAAFAGALTALTAPTSVVSAPDAQSAEAGNA